MDVFSNYLVIIAPLLQRLISYRTIFTILNWILSILLIIYPAQSYFNHSGVVVRAIDGYERIPHTVA